MAENKKAPLQAIMRLFMWAGTELNRRHKDFQSFALPTELPALQNLVRKNIDFPQNHKLLVKINFTIQLLHF